MALTAAGEWIYSTGVSATIRDVTWIIPTVQSIHIIAIALVFGSALVSDMRLAGLIATDETPQTVIRRYLPWMWAGLALLLATGTVMVVGEPDRVLANQIFWIKMGLVAFAFALTLLFRRPFLDPAFSVEHSVWARLSKPMAWLSLLVWILVILCGRWIAYAI